MQRLSLFRALLIFGILQGASNAGYWLLSITDKHLYSMGAAVFFENLCGGMGTSAFVALLMTLCNKSFSATQFALLSALSAVGRVYVGPVAGWFVEAHGWSTFYLFSVAAAVPGLILLLVCRQTLEYTRVNDNFTLPYRISCRLCLCHVDTGGGHQPVGRVVTAVDDGRRWIDALLFPACAAGVGVLVALSGVVLGGLLDYLALRKNTSDVICKYYLAVVITRRNYYG